MIFENASFITSCEDFINSVDDEVENATIDEVVMRRYYYVDTNEESSIKLSDFLEDSIRRDVNRFEWDDDLVKACFSVDTDTEPMQHSDTLRIIYRRLLMRYRTYCRKHYGNDYGDHINQVIDGSLKSQYNVATKWEIKRIKRKIKQII